MSDGEGFLSTERAYPILRSRAGRECSSTQEQHPRQVVVRRSISPGKARFVYLNPISFSRSVLDSRRCCRRSSVDASSGHASVPSIPAIVSSLTRSARIQVTDYRPRRCPSEISSPSIFQREAPTAYRKFCAPRSRIAFFGENLNFYNCTLFRYTLGSLVRRTAVSDNESDEIPHHTMLVTWGQFAQSIGLIQMVESVPLHQKTVTHRPQTKILEFFVAILAGLEYLKDLSRSAHPIDQDRAVAQAWRQSAGADYSGLSRTLTALHQEEAEQVAGVLDELTQPILAGEVMKALQRAGRLTYDGDLTGRPVSNSSTSYSNAGYGHMDDAIRLG